MRRRFPPRLILGRPPAPQPAKDFVSRGPVLRPPPQEIDAQRVQVFRHVGCQLAGRWRLEPLLVHQHAERAAQEWQPARQGLEEHHPHAVPVARRRDRWVGRLLGGHVCRRSDEMLFRAAVLTVLILLGGEAEIEQHDPAVSGHDHVRRLDVAVQLARRMQCGDPLGQLPQRRAKPAALARWLSVGFDIARKSTPSSSSIVRNQFCPSQISS